MNTQKGFTSILLILAGLIVIGGGIYFYTNFDKKTAGIIPENKIETSTTSEQIDSVSTEDKKEIAQDTDYSGFYVFSESGGKTLNGYAEMVMVYTLDIFKENSSYGAYLNIDGYQQTTRMKVDLVQKGNFLSVRLNSYLKGNTYETYKIGDTLFNLDITNQNKIKISWGSMIPAFPVTDLNNTYFEKIKGVIFNVDQVKKDIIGEWKDVENVPYKAIFEKDGTYREGDNGGVNYGSWDILKNLRNDKTVSDFERDVPNGAYLKLTGEGTEPLYYEIEKSDSTSLRYRYLSNQAVFDLVKIK